MTLPYRKYAAAIIFRRTKQISLFLLLHRKQNWRGWEYVKGGLLPGESGIKGLKREIFEETGAKKMKVIAKLPFQIKYKWPKAFQKDNKRWKGATQQIYVVELRNSHVKIDRKEHSSYKWASAKTASKLLTFKESKAALLFALKKYF
jgi:8-oxo-dGTP pyrophosphatase MutT (NUDIX family)